MKNKKKKYLLILLIFLIVINLFIFSFYKFKSNKKNKKYIEKTNSILYEFKLYMKKRDFKNCENKLYSIVNNKDMFYSLPDNLKFEIYNYLAIINLQQEKFLNALSYYEEAFKYADKESKIIIKLNMTSAYRYMGAYVTATNILNKMIESSLTFKNENSYLKEYTLLNLAETYFAVNDITDFNSTIETISKYYCGPENELADLKILLDSYLIIKAISENNLDLVPKYISEIDELESKNKDLIYSELEMIKLRSYGMYYESIGNFNLALDYFSKLEKSADNEGASYVSLFSISKRISIYKKLNDTYKINYLINKYYEKQTSINDINNNEFKYYIDNKIINNHELPFLKETIIILTILFLISILLVLFYLKKARDSKLDSLKDGLCNIYNRRFLDSYINNLKEKDLPISFLMIDVDYFKLYNDNYGHQAGDFVLKSISSVLKRNSRKEDIVSRYGGEEFCVLLKGASKYSSINYAKRIKENLDNLNIKHKYSKISNNITFSIGIYTTYTKNDLKNAIKLSDKALYISKTRGRNTYTYLEDNSSDSSN
ncbi:TPA: GGDEF domain-containing protein [Clostridium perfringens]|uniref:GGDEF domain-containing protein n=4 Tax=Clostridium perfringens TaxID=1502 RepID=UPI000E121561|nr:GGDEF domain-containing protein [Clostridium perfringens]MDG6878158.1 Phytochrome-like protein cph2 [Clostridium perfringens]MDG6885188.1 Phytochrome-like protein cph2 [Clostridium perfringens]MDG6887808.1 Phytochrome-like protein cph2 [Clostridium perfringens]MDK0721894.1 GGDEF domain-containing protein [Clostridium perfringens]MDK0772078.1 GGDEF domain-containing protein [Clostridium perfringens]